MGIQSSGCHSVGPRCMTKARHCLRSTESCPHTAHSGPTSPNVSNDMAGDIGDVANMQGCKGITSSYIRSCTGGPTTEVVTPHHHTTSMEATCTCVCDGGRQHSNTNGDCETWCHDELCAVVSSGCAGCSCVRGSLISSSRSLLCHQIQQRGVLGLRPSWPA
jgi:hypothetical protein